MAFGEFVYTLGLYPPQDVVSCNTEGWKEKAELVLILLNLSKNVNFLICPQGGALNPESVTAKHICNILFLCRHFYCLPKRFKVET